MGESYKKKVLSLYPKAQLSSKEKLPYSLGGAPEREVYFVNLGFIPNSRIQMVACSGSTPRKAWCNAWWSITDGKEG